MKKLLQILIAASLTLTGYAAGTGDGSSGTNAIEFDWVNGHTQEADVTLWYVIDLTTIQNTKGKKVHLTIKNLTGKDATIDGLFAPECPCATPQGQAITLKGNQVREKDLARSTFLAFGEKVYVRLTGTQKFHFEASIVDADPFTPITACSEATDVTVGKLYTKTGDNAWYRLKISDVVNAELAPRISVINGAAAQEIKASVAFECPVTEEMMNTSCSLAASQTHAKIIEQSMVNQIASKYEYVYILVEGKQDYQFRIDMVDPNTGVDCMRAVEIKNGKVNHHEAGKTLWYKLNVADLLANHANDKLIFSLTNTNGVAGNVHDAVFTNCEGEEIIAGNATIGANAKRENAVMVEALMGFNTQWLYLQLTPDQDLDLLMTIVARYKLASAITACEDAKHFAFNTDYNQNADESVWYQINLKEIRENTIGDVALTVTNLSTEDLVAKAELTWVCPVEYEMTEKSQTVKANDTYTRVFSREMLNSAEGKDVVYIRVTSDKDMLFSAHITRSHDSDNIQTLYVKIDEEHISNYQNMFLELLDTQSESLHRYSITNKNTYAFSGVFNGRNSLLSLRNAQHKVFGKETVSFVGNDTTITFSSLLLPVDLQVQVQNAEGTDLTEHTTVTWTDAKGNYLSKGTELKGLVEGDTVYYRIDLDETAGTVYLQPDTAIRVIADPQTRLLTYQLPILPTKTISGCVIDSTSKRPINNASVIVTQTINNKYPKLFKTTTSADGKFELQVADAPFEMVVTASNYNKRILSNLQLKDSIPMTELSCARISCELQYLAAVMDGDEPVVQNWYQDYSDIDFRVFNTTKNTAVDIIEVQYPRIFIDVEDGDELNITATSRINSFMPVDATATVMDQKASVTFLIKELGHIHASYSFSENESVAGWLYDKNGKFVRAASFEKTTMVMDDLTDGNYTLVVIGKSEMFNTVYDIRNISHIGLVKDADYVSQSISVESGKISTVSIDTVPALDISKLIYTNGSTSYTVSEQSVIIGNYLTLRGYVDFKREYAPSVSNVKLIIDIPDGCSFVEKSVMVGNHTSGYTLEGSRLIVPLDYASQRVLCCVIPTISGQYAPSAYVQFDLKGETITSPIGATGFTAETLSLFVPSFTTKPAVTVSGEAFGNAKVEVYDNGTLIGKTTAPSSGIWRMECELADAYNLTSHRIYAKATGAGMELMSETKECFYNKNANAVKTVKMTHYNAWYGRNMDVVFDMEKESVSPSSYYFYDGAEYSFVVDFINNDPSAVSDVNVYAFDYNGEYTEMPAEYDGKAGKWIAKHYFGDSNAPVNVSVDYLSLINSEPDLSPLDDNLTDIQKQIQYEDSIYNVAAETLESLRSKADKGILTKEELEDGLDAVFTVYRITGQTDYDGYIEEDNKIIERLNELDGDVLYEELEKERAKRNHEPEEAYKELERSLTEPVRQTIESTQNTPDIILSMQDPILDTKNNTVNTINSNWNITPPESSTVDMYDSNGNRITVDVSDILSPPSNSDESYREWGENAQRLMSQNISDFNNVVVRNGIEIALMRNSAEMERCMREIQFSRQLIRLQLNYEPDMRFINTHHYEPLLDDIDQEIKNLAKANKTRATLQNASKVAAGIGSFMGGWGIGTDIRNGFDVNSRWSRMIERIEECDDPRASSLARQARDHQGWIRRRYIIKGTADVATTSLGIVGATASVLTGGASLLLNLGCIATNFVTNHWEDEFKRTNQRNWDSIVTAYNKLDCDDFGDNFYPKNKYPYPPTPPTPRTPPTTIQWDPSGFVYEGVEDNRLEGVKATVYYKTTQEDPSGGTTETEVLWDAEEYGQENPLFTDEFGMYRWDVPQGLWQVRFEKDGYEPTQSEWMPVPPPQLDVNIPMVQLSQPEVVFAAAYKDAVILRFDKYMRTELLTRDNIFVSAGNQVIAGTLILSDTRDNQTDYTREVRFVPDEEFDVPAITLTVNNRVCSYAGIPMAYTFRQEFDLDGVSVIQPAAAPTASIPDGTAVSPYTELYLDCETDNAVIRYTTDGTDPDCYNGLVYTGYPIPLTEHTTTIRAIACAEGYDASEIAVFRYNIMGTSLDNPASPVRVFVEDRTLRVEGLDVTCYIYTVQGQLLYVGGNGAYRLPCGGVYLIRYGNEVVKVVL